MTDSLEDLSQSRPMTTRAPAIAQGPPLRPRPPGETMSSITMASTPILDEELKTVTRAVAVLGEPDRIESARSDKRSALDFLAVRVPLVRGVVRRGFSFYEGSEHSILEVWDHIWNRSRHYEVMLAAIVYYQEFSLPGADGFRRMQSWTNRVENWGHCDGLASIFATFGRSDPELTYPFLAHLSVSSRNWERRIAVVSLVMGLRRAAFSLSAEQVWSILDRVAADDDPYVAKGIAWVIRETVRADRALGLAAFEERRARFSKIVLRRTCGELRRAFPDLALSGEQRNPS